jgi:hypothetical protein
MAGNFEIIVFTKKIFKITQVINEMESLNVKVALDQVEVYDDWLFSNMLVSKDVTDLKKYILEGKVVVIRALLNSSLYCGCTIDKDDNDIYEFIFWVDTEKLRYLENNKITEQSKIIYDYVTDLVKRIVDGDLLLAAIGFEMSINYYEKNINCILNESVGVVRWLIPNSMKTYFNTADIEKNNIYFS